MAVDHRRHLPIAGAVRSAPAPTSTGAEQHLWMEETRFVREALGRGLRGGLHNGVMRLIDEHLPRALPARLHLYLSNACGQACTFCEQPILWRSAGGRARQALVHVGQSLGADVVSTGVFDALLRVGGRRVAPLHLEVTGNDWARHPRRDRLLARLAEEQLVRVTLSGPSTALADASLARRVAALPTLEGVVLTLQSPDPARHDLCTGAPGSGARVLQALDHLCRLGVSTRVNTVLTARAVETLPALLEAISLRGLRSTLMTFVPDGRAGGAHAIPLHPRMSDVRQALESTSADALAAIERIEGLPPCAVPLALRNRLRMVWLTEHREPLAHGSRCDGCASRGACGGVVTSYLRAHGDQALHPT